MGRANHGDVFQIVYLSAARAPFSSEQLLTLLQTCRARNQVAGLTGVLLYHDGSFLQMLEGPETTVRECLHRIGMDRRHTQLLVLSQRRADAREFPDWTMGLARVEDLSSAQAGDLNDLLRRSHSGSHVVWKIIGSFKRTTRLAS